jgi:hypothetical protein
LVLGLTNVFSRVVVAHAVWFVVGRDARAIVCFGRDDFLRDFATFAMKLEENHHLHSHLLLIELLVSIIAIITTNKTSASKSKSSYQIQRTASWQATKINQTSLVVVSTERWK